MKKHYFSFIHLEPDGKPDKLSDWRPGSAPRVKRDSFFPHGYICRKKTAATGKTKYARGFHRWNSPQGMRFTNQQSYKAGYLGWFDTFEEAVQSGLLEDGTPICKYK